MKTFTDILFLNQYHTMQGSKATTAQGVTECERIRNRNIDNEWEEKRLMKRTVDSD